MFRVWALKYPISGPNCKTKERIQNGIRILFYYPLALMSGHKNKSFLLFFYFRIPFQIIIIFVPLNEYHVYG